MSVRSFACLAESEVFGWLQRAAARLKACSPWRRSAGKPAQVTVPGPGGTQTVDPSLNAAVMVGAELRRGQAAVTGRWRGAELR